jgi:CDGSH-type Zn-finger protein
VSESAKIVISRNGPYVIYGDIPVSNQTIVPCEEGGSESYQDGAQLAAGATYALCRCGQTCNAPFCDGTHAKIGFDGTETASRLPYDEQKTEIEGVDLILEDARSFCAVARFCDAHENTWDSMEKTADPEVRARVIHQAAHCPSGRLRLRDKNTGQTIEPELPPSIDVLDDPGEDCSGPLWVRGGVTIQSQDGTPYESRNRVTLCRCGKSQNKPFCDGTHVDIKFKAQSQGTGA